MGWAWASGWGRRAADGVRDGVGGPTDPLRHGALEDARDEDVALRVDTGEELVELVEEDARHEHLEVGEISSGAVLRGGVAAVGGGGTQRTSSMASRARKESQLSSARSKGEKASCSEKWTKRTSCARVAHSTGRDESWLMITAQKKRRPR